MQVRLGLPSGSGRDQVADSASPLAGTAVKVKPLLKWPGGKRQLLQHILPLIRHPVTSYHEPFVGGGALFFALTPSTAVLSDTNADLINCYTQVRDHVDEVVSVLSDMKNTAEDYYAIRAQEPVDSVVRAARMIYLAALAFNGIHRLNLQGRFNVPYGRKTHLVVGDAEHMRETSVALAGADLRCQDFELATKDAGEGDLVYLDPPYTVAHGNNGFLKYNSKIFSWADQERLAKVARDLSQRGCQVIISNADHSSIHELYDGFQKKLVTRPSRIAASTQARKPVTELILFNEVNGHAV